jgi:hypothetical protein
MQSAENRHLTMRKIVAITRLDSIVHHPEPSDDPHHHRF